MTERLLTGPERIVVERWRQIDVEGYDVSHDVEQLGGVLARAGIAYALSAIGMMDEAREVWPWIDKPHGFKPACEASNLSPSARLKDLTRAGALIAAEMDRVLATEVA